MRRYKISPKLNPNNVFLVNNSELESRLDPHFYKQEFRILQKKLVSKPNSKLGNLIYYSNETWNQKDYFDDMFPYIEIGSINITTGVIKNLNYLAKADAPSRAKKIVRENDIIVSTTRPNRGAIAFIEKEYNLHIASTGFSVLRNLKTDSISKAYLYLILHQATSLKQMEQRCSGGNYPAITEDELRKIIIPTLDEKNRQNIIVTLQEAFKLKQQKEQKAKELLNSIDEYLLNELGIKIPEKFNSLPNRIFTTTFNKVSGNRIDPFYNDPYYLKINNILSTSKLPVIRLRDLCFSVRGVTYSSKDEIEDNNGKGILRANNIDLQSNQLILDDIRYIREDYEITEEKLLYKNDILMSAASGSKEHVGKVAFIEEDLNYYFGGFMSVLRIKDNSVLPQYLFSYLQSIIYRTFLFRVLGGTNINNLNFNMISNFLIPIPSDLGEQKQISNKVFEMRTDAKKLFEDANEELEKARHKVEKIILEDE